ncbi:MAG: SDR family oxidoreductase [Firmicutes bacterium]|jgi:NAD(P)-dependent dehydrogenase (short-subunit alcohol dehydrogenase family)|nr:SDR family oxidoreductase [Bacillota bacterium]
MAELFDVSGKVAVITGGGGILCSEMARALASRGVKVAVLDINEEQAKAVADDIKAEGGEAIAVAVDVLNKASIERARDVVLENFGTVDILINGAGGNKPEATASDTMSFFDIPADAIQWVFNLNIIGTILPTQVFGKVMVEKDKGVIINISSMAAFKPLTRTVAYSAAKAAVSNFTQWMAVHFSQNYSPNIRVNALAPGFFLTNQNYYLLVDKETGEATQRGRQIIDHTPMGRYGDPADLIGTLLWLVSDASSFVNGIVVPVDGAFSAYSGV